MPHDNLEARIAEAIQSGSAAETGALIAEAEQAAQDAAEEAERAQARALDPTLAGPALADARKTADDARFAAKRTAAAAERLREAHSAAVEAEAEARRRQVYAEARAARDDAAEALAARYQSLADELAGLLEATALADDAVARANADLPSNAARLEPVEVTARPGAGPMTPPLTRITLPGWSAGSAPIWGRPATLGGGEQFTRSRPAKTDRRTDRKEPA